MFAIVLDDIIMSDWESFYDQIVWAKVGSFDWWPCYVFNPNRIVDAEISEKSKKLAGKQYTVLFFSDHTWGWTIPKHVQLFNEETTAKYSQQKIGNKYKASFGAALDEAEQEIVKEASQRLTWYFGKSKDDDEDEDIDDEIQDSINQATSGAEDNEADDNLEDSEDEDEKGKRKKSFKSSLKGTKRQKLEKSPTKSV